VNIDSLIERFIRQFSRQLLNFRESSTTTSLPSADPDKNYLLYLHIPFCETLCPFCPFHRVQAEEAMVTRYFKRLRREIELVSDAGYVFDELYVGGGTPTVSPDELLATLAAVKNRHPIANISVETNPNHITRGSISKLRDAGVTRLSVGVQSLEDTLLQEMGRFHKYGSGEDIKKALAGVEGTFETLNVDMIFNLPHQSEASLSHDLDVLIDQLSVDQVSWYPLMTASSSKQSMQQAMGQIEYSREHDFYEIISERMAGAGYTCNSAWCFSREPGMFDEYIIDREEYLGLGSGAFSYLQGAVYSSTFSIEGYMDMIDAGSTGIAFSQAMSDREQMAYYLLTKMFAGSMDKAAARLRFDGRLEQKLAAELALLRLIGAIRDTADSLVLTARGRYLWVVLMREFFSGMNSLRDKMKKRVPLAS
jgi:coproporphyrinogen III oxidase-like Fe-S oxidoreductase